MRWFLALHPAASHTVRAVRRGIYVENTSRFDIQPRRGGIFGEPHPLPFLMKAEMPLLTELGNHFLIGCYKDAAPTALNTAARVLDELAHCRHDFNVMAKELLQPHHAVNSADRVFFFIRHIPCPPAFSPALFYNVGPIPKPLPISTRKRR